MNTMTRIFLILVAASVPAVAAVTMVGAVIRTIGHVGF